MSAAILSNAAHSRLAEVAANTERANGWAVVRVDTLHQVEQIMVASQTMICETI
jgi:hypothetical protein